MAKTTVYLDTSVINFLFADDAPEKREITVDFFDNFVKLGVYDTFVTEYVIAEINQTGNEVERAKLLKVIADYPIELLSVEKAEEIGSLAQNYLDNGIMPPKKLFDALHVAVCVVNKIDYLVSWNFKHLANINRERRVLAKNYELGYLHPLRIITPTELTGYGN
ncbi:MAG: PIN domain-containing protein [Saprospiraceae bacterium]|jgi:predicted nucleic acid-binding protein|nr:PIN domain-containing protein [Saprospiraceae bacterium]